MTAPIARVPSLPPAPPGLDAPARAAPDCRFRVVLGESGERPAAPAPAPSPAPAPLPAGPLDAPVLQSALAHILADEQAVERGLAAAMSGRSMSAAELIALQAKVIEYSQELDVASRLVERATAGVKQILATQV